MARSAAPARVPTPLLALFFCSGACGLVYQVLWLRRLSLVFGVTTYAASTVLASFMAGLAVGNWLAGRLADRARRPLVWFGAIEAAVGVTALATPWALAVVEDLYRGVYPSLSDHGALLTALRFLLASLVMLVPTTLMGTTLPIVVRSAGARGGALGQDLGWLYGTNTLGAIAGVSLAGFVLIGAIGMQWTFALAAVTNVAIGAVAITWGARGAPLSAPSAAAAAVTPSGGVGRARTAVLLVFAASGFASLALEVVWFRMLALFVTVTTYAFTIMLAGVLAGIALGSYVAAWLAQRTALGLLALGALELGVGLAALGSLALLGESHTMAAWFLAGPVRHFDSNPVFIVLASFLAVFPAALLLGVAFPIGARFYAGDAESDPRVAARVGRFCACNVGGAILGALVAGIALLPGLGCRDSLVVLAGSFVACGVVLLALARPWGVAIPVAAAGVVAFGLASVRVPDPFDIALGRRHGSQKVLARHEGVQATVSVEEAAGGERVLFVDGLHQANDTEAMGQVHAWIGHAGMLLHPRPERVLVIGLGGGATSGAIARHPGTNVEIVELAGGVVAAAPWFEKVNHGVLQRPNVRLHVADGRNWLLLAREKWDVITADIIQPFHAGAGNLYSKEYFALVREALADGGLFVQWAAGKTPAQVRTIMRTFLAVFPDACLFAWRGTQVMVGGRGPLRLARADFERKLRDPHELELLRGLSITSFDALLQTFVADADGMRAFVGTGPVLSDDRPLIEYFLSLGAQPAGATPALTGDRERIVVR